MNQCSKCCFSSADKNTNPGNKKARSYKNLKSLMVLNKTVCVSLLFDTLFIKNDRTLFHVNLDKRAFY